MIEAVVFDLDGTLVQTERLKALSYARAAIELCPYSLSEEPVIEAFKDVVGLSRREVAQALVERFELEAPARRRMDEYGVSTPWQAYVQLRLAIYEQMLADPDMIRRNQWPHNMALLQQVREWGCRTALATMSHCPQVVRILDILNLADAFDFIATRDDVQQAKPDPEIYQLVALELDVTPQNCLVIEDSPAGVQAALVAGMHVVAVSTPFTQQKLRQVKDLPADRIIDDPDQLMPVVQEIFGTNN